MKPHAIALAALILVAGCGGHRKAPATATAPALKSPYAKAMDGVIGNYATFMGGGDTVLRGYGLVVGLGDKGAGAAPHEIIRRINAQAQRYGLGRSSTNTEDITVDRLIHDRDTSVAVVSAEIPPGTPSGAPVDAFITVPPGVPTSSLEGGTLYITPLTRVQAEGAVVKEGQDMATVKGEVFVNPFAASSSDKPEESRLQEGRVIGGCTSLEQRPIRLVLHHADYGLAQSMQDSINDVFPAAPRVANAMTPSMLEIHIPRTYVRDYDHFLQLLLHVPVSRNGIQHELKARQLADQIVQPEAPYGAISLIWEAMGRQVWPVIRPLYTDKNPSVSFYAARAGLRQGDGQALQVMIFAAKDAGNPHRMEAVDELGKSIEMEALTTLKALLDSDDNTVRVAAYEAIAAGGLPGGIERISIDGHFDLDIVPSKGKFIIYATQFRHPRIALIGEGMQVAKPMFFAAADDTATLLAHPGDETLCVYRRVGPNKTLSDQMHVPFDVKSLVNVLGTRPRKEKDSTYYGLGLTYSQVVGVLYQLCREGTQKQIPAEFILQQARPADRIYAGPEHISRPDTTGGK